jgi:hypothetical protein
MKVYWSSVEYEYLYDDKKRRVVLYMLLLSQKMRFLLMNK